MASFLLSERVCIVQRGGTALEKRIAALRGLISSFRDAPVRHRETPLFSPVFPNAPHLRGSLALQFPCRCVNSVKNAPSDLSLLRIILLFLERSFVRRFHSGHFS